MKASNRILLAIAIAALVSTAHAGGDKAATMDADKDGKISATEHAAGAKAMFDKMDANGDGNITAAEMDAAHARKDGVKQEVKLSSADKIKAVDANGDGVLSADEHAKGSAAKFTTMDANGDGAIDAAEMQAGHDAASKSG